MDSVAIQWQYQPERIDCYTLETNHHLFNKETMELPGSLDKVQSLSFIWIGTQSIKFSTFFTVIHTFSLTKVKHITPQKLKKK